MKKIYITRKLPEETLEDARSEYEVEMWDEEEVPVPREILLEKAKTADALLTMLTDRIDEELLNNAPNLKVVSNLAVGYDNIDIQACRKRDIAVANTPSVLTEATADLTFGLLMATGRRLVEASNYVREGLWKSWSPMQMTGMDIYGKTIGIFGMGRIGEAVARRACGFSMKVLYHNRKPKASAADIGATLVSKEELLREADYVVMLTPYTKETHHFIAMKEFQQMKKTAIFINVSRGLTVNESDMYTALKDGEIWAAGLDVFEKEPIGQDHPLLTLPNVTVLPHIGSASIATRTRMCEVALMSIMEVLEGRRPLYEV